MSHGEIYFFDAILRRAWYGYSTAFGIAASYNWVGPRERYIRSEAV